jgi:hypothetical protein
MKSFEQASSENIFDGMSIEAIGAWAEKMESTIRGDQATGKIDIDSLQSLEQLQEALKLHAVAETEDQKAVTERMARGAAEALHNSIKEGDEAMPSATL